MSLSTLNLINRSTYDQLLAHACHEEDFVYLGSVGPATGNGRGNYSAFSALAADRMTEHYNASRSVNGSMIAARLEQSVETYGCPAETEALVGGWVGYISYELGYSKEPRLNPLGQELPLPLLSAGLYLWMASYNRSADQYYLWVHNDCPTATQNTLEKWLGQPVATTDPDWKITSPFRPHQAKSDFMRGVERVRDYITAGDCYQANLSQAFTGAYTGNPWDAFKALSSANPTPYSAFIRSEGSSVLSISPERFLSIDGRKVTTSPIKGTRKRGTTVEEDERLAAELECSEKDRAENLMIVDLLRNDISRNATTGSVRVDTLFALESYRNVHHLVSHIRCELAEGVTPMKALIDAFPGGSITGAPKIRAMEIIRELEPHFRGPYCGSVFYRGFDGTLESNIAIRTLLCDAEGAIHCCGGGGIVADSDPESEYQETLTKVKPLMDFLETWNQAG